MKKKIVSMTGLLTLTLVLAGCNPTVPSSTSTEEEQVTITWWNDYAQDVATGSTARYDFVQGGIEDFEELYPHIHVVQENHTSYSQIAQDVTTGLNGGNIPNIASVYPDNVVIWDKTPDAILHPETYFNDSTIGFGKGVDENGNVVDDSSTAYSDIESSINSEKSAYGTNDLLTLPYSRSSEALFVNQTVFDHEGAGASGHNTEFTTEAAYERYEAPVAVESKTKYEVPTNWTEMIALARTMKEDYPTLFADQRDSDNFFKALPICYNSGDNLFISFCKMMNIDYSSSSEVLFNNENAKQMMIQLKKWNNEGLIGTADQLPWTNQARGWHEYSTSMVNYGKVFMLVSSTTSGMYMGIDGYRVGVYQTPTIGGDDMSDVTFSDTVSAKGEHYAISQGPSLVLFRNASEAVQRATFQFYKFLTNTENSAGLAVTTGYFPVRQSANSTDSLKTVIDAADAVITDTASSQEDLDTRTNKYKGTSYAINQQYNAQEDYFIAPINEHSAASRTAVENLVNTVFDTIATTDEEIRSLVDSAFQTAYLAAIS